MAATAKEIAQKLGLSAAAVSLALRGRSGVSDKSQGIGNRCSNGIHNGRPLAETQNRYASISDLQTAWKGLFRHPVF